MSTGSKFHFPLELRLKKDAPAAIREAFGIWKSLQSPGPPLEAAQFKMAGYAPQHPYHPHKTRLPAVDSPHGLLFRTEDNVSFFTKILGDWSRLCYRSGIVKSDPDSKSLSYSSVSNSENGRVWTPTVPRICFSLANYGPHWIQHYQTLPMDLGMADMLGLDITGRRILLLAIVPHTNRLFRGLDLDEIVIRDRINLKRIFILNDSPDLFRKILEIETLRWPMHSSAVPLLEEKFLGLNSASSRPHPFGMSP